MGQWAVVVGLALGMGTGAGMRGSRLRGNDGRLSKSEQLPSVDAACALQGADVLDYLGHLRLGDGRYRRHVAEEPVMLRDALPHGALEGGVSVVARPVDGAYERRASVGACCVCAVAARAVHSEQLLASLRLRWEVRLDQPPERPAEARSTATSMPAIRYRPLIHRLLSLCLPSTAHHATLA